MSKKYFKYLNEDVSANDFLNSQTKESGKIKSLRKKEGCCCFVSCLQFYVL